MQDPRNKPGFRPEWYPRCDGGPAAADGGGRAAHERKLALLAAYYEINVRYRELITARQDPDRSPDREAAALRNMEQALLARDALQDEYAAYGIATSPQVENGLIRNVVFTTPGMAAPGAMASSLSMCFAVPIRPPD
jgi:hypothetical protein